MKQSGKQAGSHGLTLYNVESFYNNHVNNQLENAQTHEPNALTQLGKRLMFDGDV